MNWNLAYTPQIWPSIFTALVLIALAVYSLRRRSVPGALPFAIALLLGTLWIAGSGLELAAVDVATKIFWVEWQAAWLLPGITAITCFLLEYAWPGRWLNRRYLALLSIPCLLNVGMILTNDLHYLAWQRFMLNGEVIPLNGLGNWAFLAYAYGLGLVNLVVLVWLFICSPQHRWPVVLMLAGQLAGRVVYGLEAIQVIHSNPQIVVIASWFPIPMYAIALFAFRIFDPIPLARQKVIEQLRDGMLVLDTQGRVVSLNPAAERILQMPAKAVKLRAIQDLLQVDLQGMPDTPEEADIEFTLGVEQGYNGPPLRYCTLEISQLRDWRGMEAGRLLLLRDVTSRKQAEAALNETRETQRLIFEKSFDGISIYEERPEEDKRILVDCNDRYCQMAGRSKAELLAIQDTRVIQEAENLSEESDWSAVITETAFSGEFSWIRPDGKENIIEYKAAPIRVGYRFFTIGVDRDVTESRQAQAQILDQQRAMAMLHERTRLARELHDSIGQVLGYVSMQAQAIRKRAREGDLPAVEAQLSRLAEAAQAAHAEVRESILSLNTGAGKPWYFPTALRQYLNAYQENYGIQTHLTLPDGFGDGWFELEAEVQLLRVIQEAMNNSRKHGQAACIEVCILEQEDGIRVLIADDGRGFDTELLKEGEPGHYGLRFMRERAESLGGSLKVVSSPGSGTTVVLEVHRG